MVWRVGYRCVASFDWDLIVAGGHGEVVFVGHLYFISKGQHHSCAIWLQPCPLLHSVAVGTNQMSKLPRGNKRKRQIFLNVKSFDCVWSLDTVQTWCSCAISAKRDAGSGWRVSLVLHGVLSLPSFLLRCRGSARPWKIGGKVTSSGLSSLKAFACSQFHMRDLMKAVCQYAT